MNWWEKNPERLTTEAALMKEKFPQFQLGTSASNSKYNGVTMGTQKLPVFSISTKKIKLSRIKF